MDAAITFDDLPSVVGFPEMIRQVLQNFVSNTLKFHSSRPPRVHVSAIKSERVVVFCVEDNGIGIDEKYHKRIFLIFQRLHARDKFKGTGLSLAICKKAVEIHGGRISLHSKPHVGSKFFFSIPHAEDK